MTEAEWLACENPTPMIEYLRGSGSDRRATLFACACLRSAADVRVGGSDIRGRAEVMERYVDGAAPVAELRNAFRSDGAPAAPENPWEMAGAWARAGDRAAKVTADKRSDFFRDIFGNPFRPVTFSPSWRTDTAVILARTMYESRDFSAMPILADALQDAGCDCAEVLDHCRGPGPHVRGCWVCDMVLGRE